MINNKYFKSKQDRCEEGENAFIQPQILSNKNNKVQANTNDEVSVSIFNPYDSDVSDDFRQQSDEMNRYKQVIQQLMNEQQELRSTIQQLSESKQQNRLQYSWDYQFQNANQTLEEYKEKLEITYEVNSIIQKQMQQMRIELGEAREQVALYKKQLEDSQQQIELTHAMYERTVFDYSSQIQELQEQIKNNENLNLAIKKIEQLSRHKDELKALLKETQQQLHDMLLENNLLREQLSSKQKIKSKGHLDRTNIQQQIQLKDNNNNNNHSNYNINNENDNNEFDENSEIQNIYIKLLKNLIKFINVQNNQNQIQKKKMADYENVVNFYIDVQFNSNNVLKMLKDLDALVSDLELAMRKNGRFNKK